MRVVICWTHISGYMSACWRALARCPDVDVKIIAFKSDTETEIAFNDDVVAGLDVRLMTHDERASFEITRQLVLERKPDIIVVTGWLNKNYVKLASDPALQSVPFVLSVDTPLKRNLRQYIGRVVLRKYLQRMGRVVVAGERAWQYARFLKVPEQKLLRGCYGIDFASLADQWEKRAAMAGGWPRRFVFTGRYMPVKAIDVLVEGYVRYRKLVSNPWPLTCVGMGSMANLLQSVEGIEDRGFVQPRDLPQVLLEGGVFLIPSRFDPWPLALVEACAAGLPVIHSEACGSAVEVVRSRWNGLAVPTEDADALAKAMAWCHEHYDQLPEMGRRGIGYAAAHSGEMWATRWHAAFEELLKSERSRA